MDEDFWKERYQDRWQPAAEREGMVARLLEEETGCEIVLGPGLGAGSSEYLSGAAFRHGAERGGADLQVAGTNVYVEVTGPLKASVGPEADLWIRPDKIESAIAHPGRDNWVVHALHDNQTLRVIHLDAAFERAYENGRFDVVTPRIDGVQERYVAVPAGSGYVEPIGILVDYVRRRVRGGEPARAAEARDPAGAPPVPPTTQPAQPAAPPLPEPPAAGDARQQAAHDEGEEPAACPACGSTRIARIVYGSIRVTAEMQRDMDAGLIEFGGLGEYEGMATRRCRACGHPFGRWVKADDTSSGPPSP